MTPFGVTGTVTGKTTTKNYGFYGILNFVLHDIFPKTFTANQQNRLVISHYTSATSLKICRLAKIQYSILHGA